MGRTRVGRVRVDPDALRSARLSSGYSQTQLARRLGIAEGHTISAWERGLSGPLPSMIPRLAKVLRVKPDALLTVPDGGPTLHWLRLRAGLSIGDVADRARMSKTTYRRLELGDFIRLPDDRVIAALADALHTPPPAVRGALLASANDAEPEAEFRAGDARAGQGTGRDQGPPMTGPGDGEEDLTDARDA